MNLDDVKRFITREQLYGHIEKLQDIIRDLENDNRALKDCAIFYSNSSEYADTHAQLHWEFVNNKLALQDRGKMARNTLKNIGDLKNE